MSSALASKPAWPDSAGSRPTSVAPGSGVPGALRGAALVDEALQQLRAQCAKGPVAAVLGELILSHLLGQTALPPHLGVDRAAEELVYSMAFGQRGTDSSQPRFGAEQVRQVLGKHPALSRALAIASERALLRAELLVSRQEECAALAELLAAYADPLAPAAPALAQIVACACLGQAHLYRDMGLSTRAQLRTLLSCFFPRLVDKNVADMRWKRFFYRMLCESGGDYVCRAPSCEECSSRVECFETQSEEQ